MQLRGGKTTDDSLGFCAYASFCRRRVGQPDWDRVGSTKWSEERVSEREVVMERLWSRMVEEFEMGNADAARNLQCLLESVEGMSDKGYNELSLIQDGAIS